KKATRVLHSIEQRKYFFWLTLDSQNNVFAACSGNKVCEYAAFDHDPKMKRIRSIGLKSIGGQVGPMAVDQSGNLAISNANFIYIYKPSSEKPDLTIPTNGSYSLSML